MAIRKLIKKVNCYFLWMLGIFISITFMMLLKVIFFYPPEAKMILGKDHIFDFKLPITVSVDKSYTTSIDIDEEISTKQKMFRNIRKSFKIQAKELGQAKLQLKLFGFIPVKNVTLDIVPNLYLIPSGKTVGVKLYTKGLLVLGTGTVTSVDGKRLNPAKNILESGDMILKIQKEPIEDLNHFKEVLSQAKKEKLEIEIERSGRNKKVYITPIQDKQDMNYKIGVWVREGTQGIGTITFYNPSSQKYGALGHAITDIDTQQVMSVQKGQISAMKIETIKKGEKGNPGELMGNFYNQNKILGNIETNTENGIFGSIIDGEKKYFDGKTYPIALKEEIKEGKAKILTNIRDTKVESFDIIIQKVYKNNHNSAKQMIIQITDKKLLKDTGGIVQGMSGSPILQNGKIVGAVTHVFVNDPTRGFGIFIENMIKTEKSIKNDK